MCHDCQIFAFVAISVGEILYCITNFEDYFAYSRWGEGYQVSLQRKFWILVLVLVQLSGENLFVFICKKLFSNWVPWSYIKFVTVVWTLWCSRAMREVWPKSVEKLNLVEPSQSMQRAGRSLLQGNNYWTSHFISLNLIAAGKCIFQGAS